MKSRIFPLLIIVVFLTKCNSHETAPLPRPPLAQAQPVEDEYFGKKISDPYRYMEDMKNPEVKEWIKAQAEYARSVLDNIPGRESLIDKMKEFDRRKTTRIHRLNITDNDRYFYLKLSPEDETGKLYFRDGFEGDEIFLYDPASFSSDTSKQFVIMGISPSDDGSKIAIEVAPDGSESSIMLIMKVESKELYPEQIDRCWFSTPSWLPDGNAFLYIRLQSDDVHDKNRELDSKTYLHVLGTDPATDKEILSRKKYPELGINPEDFVVADYDKDNHYLFGYGFTVDKRLKAYYAPASEIHNDRIDWKVLFKPEDDVYAFQVADTNLYIYTPRNATHFKILKTSLARPDLANAEVVVPEDPDATITYFDVTSDGLYYIKSLNGVEERLYHLPFGAGESQEVELPFAAGSVYLRTKGQKFDDVWITLAGWSRDYQRYRYNAATGEFTLENLSSTADYPEYADLTVEELMIKSHDGAEVPLSLIYNKGIPRDGNNPVLFYGYGAYGNSMNPFFSPNFLLWTQQGGILAIPHVRGGGELGNEWYKAGYKTTKPNTWKDLIACAEYMIDEKYTSPGKIAINGGSAGGILIGRAMTERPDLFAAAIPEVGCLNPLRAEESPNGPANVPEFGTVKDETECMALIEMDAYLHLTDSTSYPATLVTAGMNDPRVIAWQPAKFAARLQNVNVSGKPVLFLTDFEAGHGIGDTKSKRFEGLADVLSFALWQTGHPDFQ